MPGLTRRSIPETTDARIKSAHDDHQNQANIMALREDINTALKTAMKSGDKLKVSTFRLMNAAIKERDIQNRTAGPDAGVSDAQILEVLAKMVKQRQESLMAYEQAGREDLARHERGEIEIIQSFMTAQVSEDEMRAEI